MNGITLSRSRRIISAALKASRAAEMKPLTVAVLDDGGRLKALEREDGCSFGRVEIAFGKAHGALAMGLGSRALQNRAESQAYFIDAAVSAMGGAMIPLAGGVLVRDKRGAIIGAVGVTGETPDNDEVIAVAAVEAVGLIAETG